MPPRHCDGQARRKRAGRYGLGSRRAQAEDKRNGLSACWRAWLGSRSRTRWCRARAEAKPARGRAAVQVSGHARYRPAARPRARRAGSEERCSWGFSFRGEEEHPSLAGNWGSPAGWLMDQDPRGDPGQAVVLPTERFTRQVTTATPAELDFRTAKTVGEGWQTRCPLKALLVWGRTKSSATHCVVTDGCACTKPQATSAFGRSTFALRPSRCIDRSQWASKRTMRQQSRATGLQRLVSVTAGASMHGVRQDAVIGPARSRRFIARWETSQRSQLGQGSFWGCPNDSCASRQTGAPDLQRPLTLKQRRHQITSAALLGHRDR